MKTRIISMFMAIIMVVTAMPILTIPTGAVDDNATFILDVTAYNYIFANDVADYQLPNAINPNLIRSVKFTFNFANRLCNNSEEGCNGQCLTAATMSSSETIEKAFCFEQQKSITIDVDGRNIEWLRIFVGSWVDGNGTVAIAVLGEGGKVLKMGEGIGDTGCRSCDESDCIFFECISIKYCCDEKMNRIASKCGFRDTCIFKCGGAFNGGYSPYCGNCVFCNSSTSTMGSGRILAGDNRNVSVGDALEILKYLARMNSVIVETNERAWNAALILPTSQKNNKPAVGDALEILKKLARMKSLVP